MEYKFLGTNDNWFLNGITIFKNQIASNKIGQSFRQTFTGDYTTDIESIANAHAMAAAPKMIDALIRVRAYLKDNEDVLAPMPVRSEIDSIDDALSDAIYVPTEIEEPLESNGLPESINNVIKNMTHTEIRNFFKVEQIIHMRCEPLRDYILKGKDDFSMSDRHNKIEKEINNLIINKYLENE